MTLRLTALTILLLLAAFPAAEQEQDDVRLVLEDGSTLRYALVLPRHFDAYREYPVLLALPPGPQDRDMVEAGLARYWGRQATARGWIVVSPVAPRGRLFFKGSEEVIPQLLDALQEKYQVEGGKFHLAGVSNGGLSAFRIAINWPERFHSLTVLPGFPPSDRDFQRLDRLEGLPIHMFAGGQDEKWVEEETRTHEKLQELEIDSTLKIFPDEGHVPSSMAGEVVMDLLETLRPVPEDAEAPAGETGSTAPANSTALSPRPPSPEAHPAARSSGQASQSGRRQPISPVIRTRRIRRPSGSLPRVTR